VTNHVKCHDPLFHSKRMYKKNPYLDAFDIFQMHQPDGQKTKHP